MLWVARLILDFHIIECIIAKEKHKDLRLAKDKDLRLAKDSE